VASLYIISILIGMLMIVIQIEKILITQKNLKLSNNLTSIGLKSLTYDLFAKMKYRRIFIISSGLYVIFFSIISGIIVYQPEIVFSDAFNVSIPSIKIVYCCGSPGQYPNVAIYITEHIGAILIPVSLLLLILISALVSWNVMLMAFAFSNRPKNNEKWLLSIGALTGLFTACPTCAGLLLTSILPGSVGISIITGTPLLLSLSNVFYQQIFLLITLVILTISPLILVTNIRELFEKGCIIEKT
jgi:hypothetical protein